VAMGCKSRVYDGRLLATVETVLLGVGVMLRIDVAMELLLHSNGHLQISTVALVHWSIDVRNMWEVSMEGSHTDASAQETN
jgi:hypothetical protein